MATANTTAKVGGHPDWIQDPEWPTWDCGARMAQLMTVAGEQARGRWRWFSNLGDHTAKVGDDDQVRRRAACGR